MSGPCVVQYLYVHGAGEAYSYPTGRTSAGPARLAERYLECALVQAASLRRGSVDAVLVVNPDAGERLEPRGRRLLDAIAAEGTAVVHARYEHAPDPAITAFAASRYLLDAIAAVAGAAPRDRRFWFADVDCVWIDPAAALDAAAAAGGVGFLPIGYAPDWPVSGVTRMEVGAIGARLGTCADVPTWVGGEALAGTAEALLGLLAACDAADAALARAGLELATEEQLLTLVGGLGEVRFGDLSGVVGRILTGPRHGAANPAHPEALAVWHLPSEKGLSFRRTAAELLAGRRARLDRDLGDRRRALRRFNVAGNGLARRVRDDGWLVLNRARDRLRALGAASS